MIPVVIFALLAAALPAGAAAPGARTTLPLDGVWEVAETVSGETPPASYPHRAPVPGLANLAEPPFPDVDRFDSVEGIVKKVRLKLLPADTPVSGSGVPRQSRVYFWYRKSFQAPAQQPAAVLRVGKAQFGTAVWLNGRKLGEYPGCFTAGYFDLADAVRWGGANELIVRIGAHPGALPVGFPTGTDNEKILWTPGIYDSVSVAFSGNPAIESVQVAPRLRTSEALVELVVRNHGPGAAAGAVSARVAGLAGAAASRQVRLAAGERKTVLLAVPMRGARLWSPEQPHLYTLEAATGGDRIEVRFGFREFRFDSATKRAMLNGKPYFLRGSNITLHRFFEDPRCKRLPWTESWVRKLLAEVPKRMHWNSFRFCIGPVPDRWLEIADEAGLLIQNEFFIWGYRKEWDRQELVRQYRDWMRDNWNHPSVVIWDAQNETRADELSDIIRAVRGFDLSGRPWENGYNLPVGPDDPVEDHPYLFNRLGKGFEIQELERMTGAKSTNSAHPTAHPVILNEYGWLWLNRDGSPTELTKDVYARLGEAGATPARRFESYAYHLGGLTEFWRAHRNFAGVLHFVHLTCSYPGVYTSDHWRDLENLELEPHFADYVGEAFRPLGVYLNFWRAKLPGGQTHRIAVAMVNDEPETARGKLLLTLEKAGSEGARAAADFELAGLGQHTYALDLRVPAAAGEYVLKAAAVREGKPATLSRRKVMIE